MLAPRMRLRRVHHLVTTATSTRTFSAFAWGNADNGQLGLPPSLLQQELDTYGLTSPSPTSIPFFRTSSLLSLSASSSHTAFIRADGALLTSGLATSGQLGRPADATQPAPVPNVPSIVYAACGSRHTLALSHEGVVYSFGANNRGQLGRDGDTQTPAIIDTLLQAGHRIVQIAAGDDFSVAVCDRGSVYTWGYGATGRLGHGAVQHPGAIAFLLGSQVTDEHTPRKVRGLEGVKIAAVSAGMHHVVVTDTEGQAWSWGSGRHFQLGNGEEEDRSQPTEAFRQIGRAAKIAPGAMHTLILDKAGRVWAVGQNEHGCLGLGYEDASIRLVSEPVPVVGIMGATDVAAGWHVSAAVANRGGPQKGGEVATWGCGVAGALGNGEVVDHWAPYWIGLRARRIAIGPAGTSVIACD